MESERINVSTLLALFEHYFYMLVGFLFAAFAMSVLPFGRCVARMEREMQRDGHPRPSGWDGTGLRIYWYASAIAFPLGWYNPWSNMDRDIRAGNIDPSAAMHIFPKGMWQSPLPLASN